jgi:hypothetical protein
MDRPRKDSLLVSPSQLTFQTYICPLPYEPSYKSKLIEMRLGAGFCSRPSFVCLNDPGGYRFRGLARNACYYLPIASLRNSFAEPTGRAIRRS